MNNREKNLMILKKALAGKLTAKDLTDDPDNPTFDITLYLNGPCPPFSEVEARQISRLKSQGLYYDVTLNIQ